MLIADAAAPPASVLVVEVQNVRNSRGKVHVDICPEAKFLSDYCPYSGDAPAKAGVTVVRVTGLPPGRYAAQVFHDENSNGKVDRALFGIPKEGVGFSRNAPIRLSPPKWQDAEFDYGRDGQVIALRLRYFLGPGGPPAAAR